MTTAAAPRVRLDPAQRLAALRALMIGSADRSLEVVRRARPDIDIRDTAGAIALLDEVICDRGRGGGAAWALEFLRIRGRARQAEARADRDATVARFEELIAHVGAERWPDGTPVPVRAPLVTPWEYAAGRGDPRTLLDDGGQHEVVGPHWAGEAPPHRRVAPDPPRWRCELHDVAVVGGSNAVIGRDGEAVTPVAVLPRLDRFVVRDAQFATSRDRTAWRWPGAWDDRVIETGILLAGHGSSNWFHWVHELEPVVRLLDDHPDLGGVPLLVDAACLHVEQIAESLHRLAPDRPVLRLAPGIRRPVRRLVVIGPILPMAPSLYDDVDITEDLYVVPSWVPDRSQVSPVVDAAVATADRGQRRRIFLGREGYASERLIVDDTLGRELLQLRLEQIDLGVMTVAAQRALLATADLVVAPAGAALANLPFLRRGTPVVVLQSRVPGRRYSFPHFSTFADRLGHPMRYVGLEPADDPAQHDLYSNVPGRLVPGSLVAAVDEVCS